MTGTLTAYVDRPRPQYRWVICIYTCDAHERMLRRFHESVIGQYLRTVPDARMLEVYADPAIPRSELRGDRLNLRTPERYEALSLKSYRMMKYCVDNFSFRRLLKIDVTTVQTDFGAEEYAGREPINLDALLQFIQQSQADKDYDGYHLHAEATRGGAENWAGKRGLVIHYDRLFGNSPMPPFFSGKAYFVSYRFAEYISTQGLRLAEEHTEYFAGAEDVMIGRLYQDFLGAMIDQDRTDRR